MPRYLIEVPHSEEETECAQVALSFLESGSHYLTNADWGCEDGVHSAWIIVEAETREAARWVVPPVMRQEARITRLNKFAKEQNLAYLPPRGR